MTLTLVFRIMAFFVGFWGVGMWLAPGTLAGNWNWDLTHELSVMMQFMGTMMIIFGVIHWKMPDWAGDNLKTPGMTFAIIHTVLLALNLFQIFVGNIPTDLVNIAGVVPGIFLTAMFYIKSR